MALLEAAGARAPGDQEPLASASRHAYLSDPARTLSALRALAVLVGFFEFVAFRNVTLSDGISYLEIARNYAGGRWSLAVNAYWSPLLSWLLAIPMKWPAIGDRWELTALHAVSFAAYLAGLAAADCLARRMVRKWTTCSAGHLRAWYITAYCIYIWAALYCIGILYCSPDMLVLAIVLAIALLTVIIAEGRSTAVTYWFLGLLVGLGYLAKAAMLPMALVYLSVIAWNMRRRNECLLRLVPSVVVLIALTAPFILALRAHTGHWTFGESARLNYAWEVCGAARSTHWQGEPGDIGVPLHPTRRLMSNPTVYEFNSVPAVTYAPWYDPSVWYAGIHPRFHPANELGVLFICGRYSLFLLLATPGVVLALFFIVRGRLVQPALRAMAESAWLTVPAIVSIGMYAAVFVDRRYIAGPLAIIGMAFVAAAIPLLRRKWALHALPIAAGGTLLAFHGVIILGSVLVGAHDLVLPASWWSGPGQYELAREIRSQGLRPGDRIGYIGQPINAYWALLDRVSIVAEVPVKYERRGDLRTGYPPTLRRSMASGAYRL